MIGAVFFAVLGYLIWHSLHVAFLLPPKPSISSTLTSFLSMEVKIFFVMISASLVGGSIPDILDPPFSRRHRAFAHSKVLLYLFIIIWTVSLFTLLTDPNLIIWFVYFFLLGYISHLALDSLTPAGLQ
ncbi:MAG: metal-dependent hydrolase [Candidatus Thermoplasmatota archaeon]|nr:metal-dependent hydrolase [Candidatus Thermoplasmatota archaeon]